MLINVSSICFEWIDCKGLINAGVLLIGYKTFGLKAILGSVPTRSFPKICLLVSTKYNSSFVL